MNLIEQIHALDRQDVEHLLHVALIRLAFVRSRDAEYELRCLRKDFGFDEYQRVDIDPAYEAARSEVGP